MRTKVSERIVHFCTQNSDGGMSMLPFIKILNKRITLPPFIGSMSIMHVHHYPTVALYQAGYGLSLGKDDLPPPIRL